MQVNSWAQSRSLQIVGLYHANERLDDKEFGSGPRKVADKLQQQCSPLACGLLVRQQRQRDTRSKHSDAHMATRTT